MPVMLVSEPCSPNSMRVKDISSHLLQKHFLLRSGIYSSPEREALACVWAVEYFQRYLLGIRFTLQTDQGSLLSLLSHSSCQRTSRRIARWRDHLQHFSYLVEHIPGHQNTAADMLSRLGADLEEAKSPIIPDDDGRVLIASFSNDTSVSIQDFIQHCQTYTDFSQDRDYILSNSLISNSNSNQIH